MEKRDLFYVNGELYHGALGGQDMRPFSDADLDTLGAEVATDLSGKASLTGAQFTGIVYAPTFEAVAVTATATVDGLTTGLLGSAGGNAWITVTSANAAHLVTIINPAAGRTLRFFVGANGCEVRSLVPGTIQLNGGTGASSTIPAHTLVSCQGTSTSTWLCTLQSTNGTVTAMEASHG